MVCPIDAIVSYSLVAEENVVYGVSYDSDGDGDSDTACGYAASGMLML